VNQQLLLGINFSEVKQQLVLGINFSEVKQRVGFQHFRSGAVASGRLVGSVSVPTTSAFATHATFRSEI
jgi:hypothetical protein